MPTNKNTCFVFENDTILMAEAYQICVFKRLQLLFYDWVIKCVRSCLEILPARCRLTRMPDIITPASVNAFILENESENVSKLRIVERGNYFIYLKQINQS